MFEKVLVPTDFSEYAQKMLDCVGEIPGLKEVVLLHVVDASNPLDLEKHGWSYDSMIDEAQIRLEKECLRLEGLQIKVEPRVKIVIEEISGPDGVDIPRLEPREDIEIIEGGSVGDAIQKTVDEEEVDVIIMGAQGKGLVKGILLGSISTDVLRHGKTNLLIIRHNLLEEAGKVEFAKFCSHIYSRVLLTTDFSPAALDAVSFVKKLGGVSEVAIANVVSKSGDMEDILRKLHAIREDLERSGIRATVHAPQGDPANEIISLADKIDASLIAMTYQGKGWLKQLRVGSVTFEVAQKTRRPMMIIRSESKN
jgi:nucleotide-binding universal stress UspA family protein